MNERDDLKEERRIVRGWISDARDASFLAFAVASGTLFLSLWTLTSYEEGIADFSAISFSLAILQTIIGVVALTGFWMVRGAAKDAARDESKKITEELAAKALESIKEDTISRVKESLSDIFDTDYGKQLIREELLKFEVLAEVQNSGPNPISIPRKAQSAAKLPSIREVGAAIDWKKKSARFIVPNTNLEQHDG